MKPTLTIAGRILTALAVLASPPPAQEPGGPDEEGCKDLKLLTRLQGCTITRCSYKDFDAADLTTALSADGEVTKSLEGKVDSVQYLCPARYSLIQIARNAENALRAAGYQVVFSGKTAYPILTMQKGPQWVQVKPEPWNEFSSYELTAVTAQGMAQEMEASADAMAAEIGRSGRVAVYGINFDIGSARLRPESDKVLAEVLSLLQKNAAWKIRVEGHTDNAGQKTANQTLSEQRAAAVVAWLTGKGVAASRLSSQGFGDSQPVADNRTEDGRAKNRRVELAKQ